jgi:hypothetical protein
MINMFCQTGPIIRFGRYDLDLEKIPPDLVYNLWT